MKETGTVTVNLTLAEASALLSRCPFTTDRPVLQDAAEKLSSAIVAAEKNVATATHLQMEGS